MSMTVNQSFETMLSRLEPTSRQKTAIKTTRENIDKAILNNPKIFLFDYNQPSFLTGSYKRNTLIRPIDDIDLYVVVNYTEHASNKRPILWAVFLWSVLADYRLWGWIMIMPFRAEIRCLFIPDFFELLSVLLGEYPVTVFKLLGFRE